MSKLLLTAPVIGDVISRCKCQVSSLRLQFVHVKSWHDFFSYAWRLRRCVQSETRRNYAKYHKHTSPPTGRENFLSMQSVLDEIVISAAKEVVQIAEV